MGEVEGAMVEITIEVEKEELVQIKRVYRFILFIGEL